LWKTKQAENLEMTFSMEIKIHRYILFLEGDMKNKCKPIISCSLSYMYDSGIYNYNFLHMYIKCQCCSWLERFSK
jgi:hypothetical protein